MPLFSGFMYAAVGSYIARVSRIFDFRSLHYPPVWATVPAGRRHLRQLLHPSLRLGSALAAVCGNRPAVLATCEVHYQVFRFRHRMNMLLGFFLVALFIWFAENIGTLAAPGSIPTRSRAGHMVSLGKFGSWYLLMIISFVLVNLVHKPKSV